MASNGEEKCFCGTHDGDSESSPKENKKSVMDFVSQSLNLRRGRSLPLKSKRNKKSSSNHCAEVDSSSVDVQSNSGKGKRSTKWPLKFYCGRKEATTRSSPVKENNCCKCTCYKQRTTEEERSSGDGIVVTTTTTNEDVCHTAAAENTVEEVPAQVAEQVVVNEDNVVPDVIINTIDSATYAEANADRSDDQSEHNGRNRSLAHIEPNFVAVWRPMGQEDVDEEARLARAREIERGVDPPASFARLVQLFCSDENERQVRRVQIFCPNDATVDSLRAIFQNNVTLRTSPLDVITGCHTQVDFIHCLVPDLLNITNCSFYWGKMDRYEAERLLDGKREGTFLLRDSAQEEFLFSVSFRKYNRSLHARIEQWNHKFSFDSHDPGVYTSDTVCGLIEHYKDPSSCMFFEPMLTWPLHRNFVFSLQHLCRAAIVSRLTYDDVNQLQLPKTLKTFLKEYHYRQKVRVERFDDDVQWLEVRNNPPT